MFTEIEVSDSSKYNEDFSVIERLADAIRIEEDVVIDQQDEEAIVQDLYEGPRKCQCCINWMTECPNVVDLAELNKVDDEDEVGNLLVIQRRVKPSQSGTVVSVHSVEIRHAATRKVLIDVFRPLDGIVHNIKYLTFLAPFYPFFWRWERFEEVVVEEQDTTVKKVLVMLRGIVKRELAGAFALGKELVAHGVITFNYLWTLFAPGELIYTKSGRHDRFY
ncbi:ATPase AAA+ type core [Colletotrichum tofieldiae]|uniref:ATPase AAA+ type core n=1 Tax=Colletotrichum tofieldiae TaxID=708197 RepID=A0A166U7G4_9PEZI|nr:ATPase AAA+ type core [Colletotrichum tofieldiae]GKT63409.1 ATPase AAA+ type core [Colletotrichum tofieldiae]GKT72585.1 ATPase AAA+ type core [Colletotrichum tofieldiae]GKT89583.1 ATPase AAA+ type core [Colletotrichum tofieldiae]